MDYKKPVVVANGSLLAYGSLIRSTSQSTYSGQLNTHDDNESEHTSHRN